LAYADDIDLIARTTPGLNEAFLKLEKSARNMGLIINQEKAVYMYSGKDTSPLQDLVIGNYIFKRVDNFKYLGTVVNKVNDRTVEVNARLIKANRAYYGLQFLLFTKSSYFLKLFIPCTVLNLHFIKPN